MQLFSSILIYLLGMCITFIVSSIYLYRKNRNEYAMLPNISSILSKSEEGDKVLLYVGSILFIISVPAVVIYQVFKFLMKLPKFIVNLILQIAQVNDNKILEGRIALLKVGDIINLVRYDRISDGEGLVIMEIRSNSIVLRNDLEIPKENIVLIDGDLYALMRPYKD